MKSLLKKFLVFAAVLAATLAVLPTEPTYAEGFAGSCRSDFLGMTSWDCGVNINNEDDLKAGIWTIVANIVTDITVIAAYLIVGYVIYGGYLYIFSAGDPGKVATGKKALTQAFIGLAIVISANVILNAIRFALLNGSGSFSQNCVSSQCVNPGDMVINAINWVIGIAGAVSLIFVVYGGISYTTSSGDPGKLQQAKKIITYALIGLAIVALSEMIVVFVSGVIKNANETALIAPQTLIAKEIHEI